MNQPRYTVADLLALKGKRQLTKLQVRTAEEAAAAAAAGIDLLSVEEPKWTADVRAAAPACFVVAGLLYGALATADDYIRAAFKTMTIGADAVYSAASLETIKRMQAEGIPVVGHVGLVPSRRTWTGGFRAVGKSAASALRVYEDTKRLEEAGAFAAEIEVTPARVAAEISKRTSMLMISMGSGTGCDAQYLFAEDILGAHRGHYPRHAKKYRDFLAEYERLQRERIAAFAEFASDVAAGRFPADTHVVGIADDEFAAFERQLATV